ncbi:MAG: DUF305 domain-containing protein [Hansschlegelia sp.]
MRSLTCGLAAAAFTLVAFSAVAQDMDHGSMGSMDHMKMGQGSMGATSAGEAPSTQAYKKAHAAMMKGMKATFTGDPDRDFLQGMIPHHQGAIDMAKVVLQYGKDPEVKKLAQQIVEAQEREIAEMNRMLAALGPAAK